MAPIRKSRGINRKFLDYADVSPVRVASNSNKSRPQKKKLSDLLGPRWSEVELERFYKAYRKYGKDWKKVSSKVRTRPFEMVQALYNMNTAYLSLPEGTASVNGFIAMMSDHYAAQVDSESDQESNVAQRLSQKPKKRSHREIQLSGVKESFRSEQVTSSNGSVPFLKRRESDGCTVGRRTPRVTVNHASQNYSSGKDSTPYKSIKRTKVTDDNAHEAALTLAKDLQRGGSPQISQSPSRINKSDFSLLNNRGKLPGTRHNNIHASLADEDSTDGRGTVELSTKMKKAFGKKESIEGVTSNQVNDTREGREGHHAADESSALAALQTLADLSLMMPLSEEEPESPTMLQKKSATDLNDRPNVLPAGPSNVCREKRNSFIARKKMIDDFSELTGPKYGKSEVDLKAILEAKEMAASKSSKKKRKLPSSKDFMSEEDKLVKKVKSYNVDDSASKETKSLKSAEIYSSVGDTARTRPDSAVQLAQHPPSSSGIELPSKRKNKRKMDPKRMLINNEMRSTDFILKDQLANCSTLQKDKVSCCLSSYMVRRWCTFEWFYSAIDYPWFAKKEFVEYLNHVGLGNIPGLTHVEWSVIRSSLGKPRRFSETFLHEEREKLRQYRQSVRKHYSGLRTGSNGLPADLARPLSVGQRVVAIHPVLREVYDGSVLTVDHEKCRIQFDRPELGVEFVMDIDCMPLDPLDNMPEALKRQTAAVDKYSVKSRGPISGLPAVNRPMMHTSTERLEDMQGKGHIICATPCKPGDNVNAQSVAYSNPGSVAAIHSRETDIHAVSELAYALNKKEVILSELKVVNDDLLRSNMDGDSSLKNSETFRKQYAMVLVQLKEASDQVSSALLNLRQRNTYPANSLPSWMRPSANFDCLVSPKSSLDNISINNEESVSNVIGIINDSRVEAEAMVQTAIQAKSKLKDGENAFQVILEALDGSSKQNPPDNKPSIRRSPEHGNRNSLSELQLTYASDPLENGHASLDKLDHETETPVPSELIASCIATLSMIKMSTERHCPPADVADIIDSAVTSLRPHCPQNLPIYRELQMCMGRVRTQILALVPM